MIASPARCGASDTRWARSPYNKKNPRRKLAPLKTAAGKRLPAR